ncbi:MAG: hypothetical protein WCF65_00360 [Parachlamydiaceae bacterium]
MCLNTVISPLNLTDSPPTEPLQAASGSGSIAGTITPSQHAAIESQLSSIFPERLPLSVKLFYTCKNVKQLVAITKLSESEKQAYRRHNIKSRLFVHQFAQGVKGKALVLGPVPGDEINLSLLAAQFDHVTLVDIDVTGMEKMVETLSPELKGKTRLIQEDLTGMLSFISEAIDTLDSEKKLSKNKCVTKVIKIINTAMETCLPKEPHEKYDFIVSSMVSTDLTFKINDYILNALKHLHPDIIIDQFAAFQETTENLKKHLCKNHIAHLSQWTLPDGKVFYADILNYECFTRHITNTPSQETGKLLEIQRDEKIKVDSVLPQNMDASIDQQFSQIKPTDQWELVIQQPKPKLPLKFDIPSFVADTPSKADKSEKLTSKSFTSERFSDDPGVDPRNCGIKLNMIAYYLQPKSIDSLKH